MALKFNNASNFKNGYAVVENFDFTKQLLHISGNLVPGTFHSIYQDDFKDGYTRVETEYGKYNFVDTEGNLLLEEDLDRLPEAFSEGFSIVKGADGKSVSFINTKGKPLTKEAFKKAGSFINGFAEVVVEDGTVGFINSKGKVITDKSWDKFHNFHDGYALIKDNKGKYFFINEKGKKVSDKYTFAQDFCDGRAVVGELRKVYKYLDQNCREMKGSYSSANSFKEGYACVSKGNDNYFIIDTDGNKIADIDFSASARDIKEGMILERNSSGYTFYNIRGKKLNQTPFEYAEDFINGYAPIKTGNNWTCIDKVGNFVPFTSPLHFHFSEEGLAKVESIKTDLDGNEIKKYKFINRDGRDATEEFDDAEDFCEGYAVVKKGNICYYIDKTGRYLGNDKQSSQIETKDVYGFKYESLTNDELFYEYIKANVPVFLHGPSGVGKSTRVKALDPTATRITLRPQMNPEEIDGSLNRSTGAYIPPLWYKQITEKCEKEPNRKHVLFIDELTNVKPTVQSLVYSIVLDRAGKDGLWPLPDNAVVVAAGNENEGNLAAYPLTNALFRRFCHIYYDVSKNEWFNWATSLQNSISKQGGIPHQAQDKAQGKVHPAIVSYVMSRGADVLNQDLDEENPKIVADPRKWEIASRVLYSTNNPNSLVPAIGKELTTDFVSFVNTIQLTVDDIKSGNYSARDLRSADFGKQISTVAGLSMVEEEDLLVVRDFINKNLGPEMLATYDSMWISNDPERALIIDECNLDDLEDANIKE